MKLLTFKLKIGGGWIVKKAKDLATAMCQAVEEISKYFSVTKIFAMWMEDGKAHCRGLVF